MRHHFQAILVDRLESDNIKQFVNIRYKQGRSQGGALAPPNQCSNLDKTLIWGGGGCEVKRDHTLRKLWIDHVHKAGKCSLEALEISNPPPPPKSGVWLRPWIQTVGVVCARLNDNYAKTLFRKSNCQLPSLRASTNTESRQNCRKNKASHSMINLS